MPYMDELMAADEAVEEAVRKVVERHRSSGILTWALLHQIETEVITYMTASGEFSSWVLNMIRSADVFGYPKNDRPVSFEGSGIVPIVFGEIDKAWRNVH